MRLIFFSIFFLSFSHLRTLYMLFFSWILLMISWFYYTIFTSSFFLYPSFSVLFLSLRLLLLVFTNDVLLPSINLSIPFSPIVLILVSNEWFYFYISIFLTSASADLFALWSRKLKCWGGDLPIELRIVLSLSSWIFQDLFSYLSKQSLLLVGIARNIL